MKLTNITAKNLKGRKFSHDLAPLTMIVGPNDKGKTAIADAVRLAFLGYLPGHPKSNAGIFALSSGAAMMVAATLEDGRKAERAWKAKGKSATAETHGVEDLPETPLALMDAAEYFGKTDAGRTAMAFGLLDLSKEETTAASLTNELRAMVPATDELLQKSLETITTHEKEGETVQEWLDEAIARAGEEVSLSKKEVTRYAQTAQGLANLGLSEDPVDAAAIAKKITQARGELQKLEKEKSARDQELESIRKRADAIRERHRQAEELRAKVGAGAQINGTVADLSSALKDATERLGGLEEKAKQAAAAIEAARQAQEDLDALLALVETWKANAANLEKLQARQADLEKITAAPPDTDATASAQSDALSARTHITADRNQVERELRELERQLSGLECRGECPTCGTQGKEFHETVKALFGGKIAEKRAGIEKLDRDFQEADERLKTAQAAHNAELARKTAYDKALRDLATIRVDIQAAAGARENLERAAEQEARLLKLVKVPEFQSGADLEKARRVVETLTTQLDRKRAAESLAALGDLEPIPDLEAMESEAYRLECDIEEKQSAIAALEEEEKKAQSQLADQKRLQQAADERKAAEGRVETLGTLRKKLQTTREDLVNKALAPLLVTANTFTAGILDTPLELREGEIGRQVGAAWVPVRCFGGTYTAITYAAIQAALGAKAPARIVIVDEMGRMDAANKVKFLENVRKALDAGLLDQFVGIDVRPEDYTSLEVPKFGLHLIEVRG